MQDYLTQLTDYLLAQSWQIAVLVVVIAAATWLLRNRSAHTRYLLWLIVLVKCLTPPLLEVSVAVLPEKVPAPAVMTVPIPTIAQAPPETPRPAKTTPAVAPVASSRPQLSTRQWLAIGWMIGATAFACIAVAKGFRTVRWLQRDRRPLPHDVQTSVNDLLSRLNLRRLPKMWLLEGIGQPFVWGALRGNIYLPATFVRIADDEHRRHVLGHELSHVTRFDAAVNLLQTIAQAVFWFHPFVWWANKKIRAEREKCCDEMAIARLGAKDYSSAIVQTLIAEQESTRAVPSLAVAGPVKNIEERIKTMLRPGKRFRKRPSLIAATFISLLTLLIAPTALVLTARAEHNKTASQRRQESFEPLHEAVINGDLEKVKALLGDGVDVNVRDSQGRTALHKAAALRKPEMTELLLSHGADVHAKTNFDSVPLHFAAGSGHVETVEALLKAGANINQSTGGRTPIHLAICSNRREIVSLLIARGAELSDLQLAAYRGDLEKVRSLIPALADANAIDSGVLTPVHCAACGEQMSVLDMLLSHGVDVDGRGWRQQTPLHMATQQGNLAMVEHLLAHDASVDARDKYGHTPLYAAAGKGHVHLIEPLLSAGADINVKAKAGGEGYTPLHLACHNGHYRVVQLLLQNGANVHAKDGKNRTPHDVAQEKNHTRIAELLRNTNKRKSERIKSVHQAAAAGDIEQVKLILSKGTDVNKKGRNDQTALHRAAGSGHLEVVKLLLAQGADINAQAKKGWTPLHEAADHGHDEIVKLLMAKGAEHSPIHMAAYFGNQPRVEKLIEEGIGINKKDKVDFTPLHSAVSGKQQKMAEFLINKGIDINAKDKWGWTALIRAIWNHDLEISKVLVENGASVNVGDENGFTPLTWAIWEVGDKAPAIVDLLIANGANINQHDKMGCTPLYWAAFSGGPDMFKMILGKEVEPSTIHMAAYKGDLAEVKAFVEEGVHVDTRDEFGCTALLWASAADELAIADFLIAKGADLNAKVDDDKAGFAPLTVARSRAMIERLISNGADLNIKTFNGRTKLHGVCMNNEEDLAALLIQEGANLNAKDEWGNTPLHLAASKGYLGIAKLLLQHEANIHAETVGGHTPLWNAKEKGHTAIAELLRKHGAKE